jgi:hypothetical protein
MSRPAITRIGLAVTVATAITMAPPAHADPDTDFANQLQGYGIYGPRDYNAWLAKVVCERVHNGVDTSVQKSTDFLSHSLPRGTTPTQWAQFLATAIGYYCPDEIPFLQNA